VALRPNYSASDSDSDLGLSLGSVTFGLGLTENGLRPLTIYSAHDINEFSQSSRGRSFPFLYWLLT